MNLYIWDSVDTLADYYPGHVYALAADKPRAVELIMQAESIQDGHAFLSPEEFQRKLRSELENTEPTIVNGDHEYVEVIWGTS